MNSAYDFPSKYYTCLGLVKVFCWLHKMVLETRVKVNHNLLLLNGILNICNQLLQLAYFYLAFFPPETSQFYYCLIKSVFKALSTCLQISSLTIPWCISLLPCGIQFSASNTPFRNLFQKRDVRGKGFREGLEINLQLLS